MKSKTIAIALAKGGTTKTTSTINIGAALAEQGNRVAVIDNDPQSNLTTALGYQPKTVPHTLAAKMMNTLDKTDGMPICECMPHCNMFDLLPSSQKLSLVEKRLTIESKSSLLADDGDLPAELVMRKTLEPLREHYDFLLIDCPPSAGLLTINAMAASDSVLIPMEAHFLSFDAIKQTLDLISRIKAKLNPGLAIEGILLTKYQDRTNLCRSTRTAVQDQYGDTLRVFAEPIAYSIKAAEQSVHGASIFETDPHGKIAAGYMSAAKEVIAHGKQGVDAVLRQRLIDAQKKQQAATHNDPTNKALDRDYDEQFNLTTHAEDVILVSIKLLRPYANHPFKAYTDDKMNALIESIHRDGLHQPILIREVEGVSGYEILAGHNRVEAMRRLGERDITAILKRGLDDDKAALVVVTTNLEQRDKLLPSEKAFAYRLQMEALQRQKGIIPNGDLPSDGNGLTGGYQDDTQRKGELLSAVHDESYAQIFRYIKLTSLLPELLDLLDQDRIPLMAGYELSFLDAESQEAALGFFFSDPPPKEKLTVKAAETIRAAFQAEKPVTAESIPAILQKPQKKKPGPVRYSFSLRELRKQYPLPDGFDVSAFLHEKLREEFVKD